MYTRQVAKTIARTAPTKLLASRITSRNYAIIEPATISDITAQEKKITGNSQATKGGPTSVAQKYRGKEATEAVLQEIQAAANRVAGQVANGGQANAQNQNQNQNQNTGNQNTGNLNQRQGNQPSNTPNTQGLGQQNNQPQTIKSSTPPSTTMNDATYDKIAQAETQLSGQNQTVPGGPADMAAQHANEPITSQVLQDITSGEKIVTGGQRVAGGPTSIAQSALGKGLNAEGRDSLSQNTGGGINNNNNTLESDTNANGTPNISNSATSTLLGQQPYNTNNNNNNLNNNQTPNFTNSNFKSNSNNGSIIRESNNPNPNDPISSDLTGEVTIMNSELISRIAASESKITGQTNMVPAGPAALAQSLEGQPITTQILHDITESERTITGATSAIKGGPTSVLQSSITKSNV